MEAGESSLFLPQVPHFYKLMHDEDVQGGKLIIPSNFVWKYGTHLCKSNHVVLKLPTGDTWEVELRDTDVFRLEKGWPEFLKFYTIERDDLLIFRYEPGSSNELHVVLCNKTCTELGYPKKPRRVNIPPVVNVDEVTAEEARESHASRRTPLRTGMVPSRRMTVSRKRLKAESYLASKDNSLERKREGIRPSSSQADTRGTHRGAERPEALEGWESFISTKPYFVAEMQPHSIRPPYHLNIPIGFAKEHMGQTARGEMELLTSSSDQVWSLWTAGYTISEAKGQADAKVVLGWKTFVEDNGLELGDVCAFELNKSRKATYFDITIFKAPSSHSQSQLAPLFVSEHPFFQVVMKETYISRGYMHIPIGFMRDHISLECKKWAATLEVGGDSFSVNLIMSGGTAQHRALLFGGVTAFLREKSLKAGDTCTFELIQPAEMVFRVSISKAN